MFKTDLEAAQYISEMDNERRNSFSLLLAALDKRYGQGESASITKDAVVVVKGSRAATEGRYELMQKEFGTTMFPLFKGVQKLKDNGVTESAARQWIGKSGFFKPRGNGLWQMTTTNLPG